MGLLQNGTLQAQNLGRRTGGTVTAADSGNLRASFGIKGSTQLARFASMASYSKLAGIPFGYANDDSMYLPLSGGGLSSSFESRGLGLASATLAEGRPIAGTAAGTSAASATGQLVVSGSGSAAGVATVTGGINAAINGAGSITGTCTVTGAMTAFGRMSGSAAGGCTVGATIYATGALSGSIAPAIDLDAAAFSAYLLDQEDIEAGGLTLRKTLRLLAAAAAGKASGLDTTTAIYRNAVADNKDRITATVDADGNRTVVTLDLDD